MTVNSQVLLYKLQTCEKVIDDVRQDQCSKYNKRGRTYKPFEPHMGKKNLRSNACKVSMQHNI